MQTRAGGLLLGACLAAACSRSSTSQSTPPAEPSPSEHSPTEAPSWLDDALAELPEGKASTEPWDLETCPGDLPVEPCPQLPAAASVAVFELTDGVAVDWCNAEDRVVVRCYGDAPEGPFDLRSVARYEEDGIGFQRIDEEVGDGPPSLEVTIHRGLPDGARQEITLEWDDRAATQPSSASMFLYEGEVFVRHQAFSNGLLTGDEDCVGDQDSRRCTRRSFEEGTLYRTFVFYEEPPVSLQASRTTLASGTVESVYVERGKGPLAPLLHWSRTVWGGPPEGNEEDIAIVSWMHEPTADDPAFELIVQRIDFTDGVGESFAIGQGRLEGQQLCAQTCDSVGSNCSQSQCRQLSPEELEKIHADAKREVDRRLSPQKAH